MKLVRGMLGFLIRPALSKNSEGLLNIPQTGGVIIAANHQSFYDAPAIMSWIWKSRNEKVHYFADQKILEKYWGKWVTKNIFEKHFGVITVEPEGTPNRGQKALQKAKKILKAGGIVAIFPEGRISDDGKLCKGHTGIARLVLWTGCPLLPVGLKGFHKFADRKWIPNYFKGRGEVHIGKIRVFEKVKVDYKAIKFITKQIMLKIGELTDKKYKY